MLHGEGISGVVFLSLYIGNLVILLYGYSTRRIKFRSVYSVLLLHVFIRIGAQSVGIALGTQSGINTGLLVAFFVLGAEGYFSLVLCAYRFLIRHHQLEYPIDGSWLEGNVVKVEVDEKKSRWPKWLKKLKRALTAKNEQGKGDPWAMSVIHWMLIAANVVIVYGGAQGFGTGVVDNQYKSRLRTAKACRIAGQTVFLVINLFLGYFFILTAKQDRNPAGTLVSATCARAFRVKPEHGAIDAETRGGAVTHRSQRFNIRLLILLIAWPPLIVRGVFGLLQAIVPAINYASADIYDVQGSLVTLGPSFVASESCLAILPEWIACCLLCSTMFTRQKTDR